MLAARLERRADVIHINISVSGSTYRKMMIAACARLLSIPYVLHLHGAQYQTFWKDDHSFMSRRIRALFEHAGRVIVLGGFGAISSPAGHRRTAAILSSFPTPRQFLPWRMSAEAITCTSCSSAASASERACRSWARRWSG
ncbi:glycosyltransferase family 4 protein [Mesorhizobium sp. C264A]